MRPGVGAAQQRQERLRRAHDAEHVRLVGAAQRVASRRGSAARRRSRCRRCSRGCRADRRRFSTCAAAAATLASSVTSRRSGRASRPSARSFSAAARPRSLVARTEEDGDALARELARDLEPDPLVGSGDDGDAAIRHAILLGREPRRYRVEKVPGTFLTLRAGAEADRDLARACGRLGQLRAARVAFEARRERTARLRAHGVDAAPCAHRERDREGLAGVRRMA